MSAPLSKRQRRLEAFQPTLNAYVCQVREEASRATSLADELIARQASTGASHGVPLNVKESFGVAGSPALDAGAIVLGATNVRFELMHGQA